MIGKLILATFGAGVTAGVITGGKFGGARDKVRNTFSPKKNRVAHIKVHLEPGVDISDLCFLVVEPTTEEEG